VNPKTLKSLFLPGGALLLLASVVLESGLFPISASAINFYYAAVFFASVLLAWRFHSSRIFFALLTLLLAHRALEFFSSGHIASLGPGRIALESISFLLPVNFIVLSFIRERGFAVPVISSRLLLLFFESVFVALLCRPGAKTGLTLFHAAFLGRTLFHWTKVPHLALLAFAAALGVLAYRFFLFRKPVESGLLWATLAAFVAMQKGGLGTASSAYIATAGLILLGSIIENSYVLAYHDELTSLPARRAFNEALLRLEPPYAIAVVDIDHFKGFNDTYGHDIGDQVLRLVAAKLARVTGGGNAYRVGGEEFNIVFSGTRMKEAAPHLEMLRAEIERSTFRLRGLPERRTAARGPDRRTQSGKAGKKPAKMAAAIRDGLSVTVSIGVAEATAVSQATEEVIEAADKALYRAKQAGRNRVETTASARAVRSKRRLA
jgi:diguanylate cyclase (GGDEF)-like protein